MFQIVKNPAVAQSLPATHVSEIEFHAEWHYMKSYNLHFKEENIGKGYIEFSYPLSKGMRYYLKKSETSSQMKLDFDFYDKNRNLIKEQVTETQDGYSFIIEQSGIHYFRFTQQGNKEASKITSVLVILYFSSANQS